MGLSFHDEPSLTETANGLRFAPDDPRLILEMGSFSQDESLPIGPDDPNPNPNPNPSISPERRR